MSVFLPIHGKLTFHSTEIEFEGSAWVSEYGYSISPEVRVLNLEGSGWPAWRFPENAIELMRAELERMLLAGFSFPTPAKSPPWP